MSRHAWRRLAGVLPVVAGIGVQAGLLSNGTFAEGTATWGSWSATPERLRFEVREEKGVLSSVGAEVVSGCLVTEGGRLEPSHRYRAAAVIDAAGMTVGKAVLRIEFWNGEGSGPVSTMDSQPVAAGEVGAVTVPFSPPAGAVRVRIAGYMLEAVGAVRFDDMTLVDLTGPLLRAPAARCLTAGMPLVFAVEVVNGGAVPLTADVELDVTAEGVVHRRQTLSVAVTAGGRATLEHRVGPAAAGTYRARWRLEGATADQIVRVIPGVGGLAEGSSEFSRYGGWRAKRGAVTGFFHTERIDGRWWLVDPEGFAFLSIGVNGVNPEGTGSPTLGYSPYRRSVAALYADEAAWVAATLGRLRAWGFNTIGSWSSPMAESSGMPYCHILDIGRQATGRRLTQPREGRAPWFWFPDVFAPEFAEGARRLALERCAPRRDDPYLVGYFLDNEFSWDGLWEAAFESAPDSACRDAFAACVQRVYPETEALRAAWAEAGSPVASVAECRQLSQAPSQGLTALREAWLETVAERYFSVCAAAVRAADPNHLIISQRFAGWAPDAAVRAAGRHCDVFCINFYNGGLAYGISEQLQTRFRDMGELTGTPILIGEWSFKALDSGLPNTRGAATPVETQADRAVGYASYLTAAMANPYIIGAHWFIHSDQPFEGRFDGENSNYGLVDLADQPYGPLVVTAAFMNRFVFPLAGATAFGHSPVQILPTGAAWVRVERGELIVNPEGDGDQRFLARQGPVSADRWLQIGAHQQGTRPPPDVSFVWRDGECRLGGGAGMRGQARGYHIRELGGEGKILDRGREALLNRDGGRLFARPFADVSPRLLPDRAGQHRVTLTVRNPTTEPLSGRLDVEPSTGWGVGALPPLVVAAGGRQDVSLVLTAPAESMAYPRLVIWEPFIDVIVFRVGTPVCLAATVAAEGVDLVFVSRDGNRPDALVDVSSEPPGLSRQIAVNAWRGGICSVRVPWVPAPDMRSMLIRARYREKGIPGVDLQTRVYRIGYAGDWQCETGDGMNRADDGGGGDGYLLVTHATPGTTSCVLPTVPTPGSDHVVRVCLEAMWENVVRGAGAPWHRANVALYFLNATGDYVSHVDVLLEHGSGDWQRVTKRIRVPDGVSRMQLKARLLECTGTLGVRHVELMALPAGAPRGTI